MTPDPQKIADFLLEHGPSDMLTWDPALLDAYIKHHLMLGQLAIVYQADGAIVGAGVARAINRRKQEHLKNTWRTTDVGNTIYIENGGALHPTVVPRLLAQMVKRFGLRKWVMARRHKKFKYWSMERFLQKANLLTRHAIPLR